MSYDIKNIVKICVKWKFQKEKCLLTEPLCEIQLCVFIGDTSALPVIISHRRCVPQPSGGPFCVHSMTGEGPILLNLCPSLSSHVCVLGTRILWRAIGSPARVSVLSCATAIVHPLLPRRPPPPTCPTCSSSPQPG